MRYFLDITPAIVNKTAIHNIIKDSIENLPLTRKQLLLLGKPYHFKGTFESGLPFIMKIALKFPRLFILIRRVFLPLLPEDSRPIFLFDPLYLLFYKRLPNAKVMILDMTTLTHPEWHGMNISKLYQEAFTIVEKYNLGCYSISESTRYELKKILRIQEDKNHLLYIYAHNKYQPHQKPIFSKQILFVGSFEPRKNLIGLIKAFQESKLKDKGFVLNIVGSPTAHYENIKSSFLYDKSIVFHGYLSNEELHNVYQKTQVFAYPSHWEGFGVPLLEAINLKIASFASKTSACPEVGGPKMLYVDPNNITEISSALVNLCQMTEQEYLNYTQNNWTYAQKYSLEIYIKNLEKALE